MVRMNWSSTRMKMVLPVLLHATSKCTVKQWISGLAHQVQANKSVALRAIESNVKASAWDCCIVSLLSLGICMAKTNQLLDVAPSNTISV